MTDKKFTDDEIIKSKDACVIGECERCVYISVEECGCRDALIIGLSNVINRLKAENFELQANLKFVRGANDRLIELAEIDAIKEFAYRLKEKHGLYGEIWESDIDKTLEEMMGETV